MKNSRVFAGFGSVCLDGTLLCFLQNKYCMYLCTYVVKFVSETGVPKVGFFCEICINENAMSNLTKTAKTF